MFIQCLGDSSKTLAESPVVAHEAKESANLHIGLRWYTLSNGLLIQITRPDTLLGYSVLQIVYLFFEKGYTSMVSTLD